MIVKFRLVGLEKNDNNGNKIKYVIEKVVKNIFLFSVLVVVVSLFLIIGFVFYKGLRLFIFEGYLFIDFLIGVDWVFFVNKFGILFMIVVLIFVIFGVFVIGVFVGILIFVFIVEVVFKRLVKIMLLVVEFLVGIFLVLYGVFGFVVIVLII